MRQLQSPQKASQMESFQQEVVSSYFKLISQQELFAREGNQGRWDASSIFLREKDPYYFENFRYALSRFPSYVACIQTCGPSWLGQRFKFPILWWPTRKYQSMYRMTKKVEKQCWNDLIAHNKFKNPKEKSELSFNLTHLHRKSFESELDSD